ncbi:MAG: helix-turn-helix transcriptional regulator [Clostridium sp.]|uniref:helix-turn-helix domain-containing protein n=1 Tax=Clostridium sp. TaxID=1506 RepID=UPI0029034FB3|nr:helix-turn-helix transcriptional regulator [Clostridium sp.]MDU1936423.1 helix-turn-helix transcriptional regulator [Clostridium sp.]MDU2045050.1 helix-turn-helix transcriptional regulator [Clostridium sp.]
MIYKLLGKKIREERLKLNLTQEQLAEKVDISTSYVGQIERGERNISLDTLVNLSNTLGVTIDFLLQDSININEDTLLLQINQLISSRNTKEKEMALDVLKIMFSHIDKRDD